MAGIGLGRSLYYLRAYNDIRANQLSKDMGLSQGYISEIENGKKLPSIEVIFQYASFFKVPASSIFLFSEQPNNINPVKKLETFTRIFHGND